MKALLPFLRLLRTHQKWAVLGLLLSLLTLIAGIGLLSTSGWFISAAAFAGLTTTTALAFNYFLPSAGVRFFALLRILSRYGERVVTHEVTFRVLSDLRVWVYNALEPLVPGHLLRYHSAELLTRMVADVDALDNLYIRVLTPILTALSVMLLVLWYLHFFSMTIAWVVLGMLLLTLILVPVVLAGLGKNSGQQQLLCMAALRTTVVESVQGLADLLLLGRWQDTLNKMEQQTSALLKTQFEMALIQGLAAALLLFLSGITLWLVVYCAIPLVNAQQLNGANLALLALTALAAFEALAPIALVAQYFSKTRLAAQRLQVLADTKPEVIFPEKSATLPVVYDIEFDRVSFGYHPDKPVLRDFCLSVAAGEHVALVGATGVGKSTVVQLLARFFNPQQGKITIGGVDIATLSESDLRQAITLITQRPHLFSATLRDNLLLAKPDANDAELAWCLEKVQLNQYVTDLERGLNTWLGEGGMQLSGGQLRRLSIARALLHSAPIWLLDEPTEGLDAETEAAFWQSLIPLMQGKTVLIISHQLASLPVLSRVIAL